jgi:CheY-like chemotaxis protein
MRILLVEDNAFARFIISRYLRELGNEVTESGSGTEALRLIDSDYSLYLLDLALPGCDGYTVARRIRAIGITTPVVCISNQGDEARSECEASGFDDCVGKPISVDDVIKIIKKWGPYETNTSSASRQTGRNQKLYTA